MQDDDYHGRWLEGALRGPTSRGKVRLIFGARQTGKSALLRRLAPHGARLINLQDARERLRYERSPGLLADELRAESRRLTVCIDEVQKVPSILDDIQLLVDELPGRFQFLVTGSSARRLRAGAANLLPGRAHAFTLFPLVAAERDPAPASVVLRLPRRRSSAPPFAATDLEERLVWGGLPGVSLESTARRARTLATYTEVYLEEEIRREALVRDVGAFARFLELAAMESGRVLNLTSLSQESGVAVSTLRTFYQVLVDTFVGYWVPAYGQRSRKRLLTTPRFCFFDLGVRNSAARLPLSDALLRTQSGELFEQWVTTELVHRAAYLGRSHRVSFWRTAHGAEVDVIVETASEALPIEVKWTERPRPTDARHIEAFLDTYPDRARRGFVVCRCPRPQQLTERVTALPWQAL